MALQKLEYDPDMVDILNNNKRVKIYIHMVIYGYESINGLSKELGVNPRTVANVEMASKTGKVYEHMEAEVLNYKLKEIETMDKGQLKAFQFTVCGSMLAPSDKNVLLDAIDCKFAELEATSIDSAMAVSSEIKLDY